MLPTLSGCNPCGADGTPPFARGARRSRANCPDLADQHLSGTRHDLQIRSSCGLTRSTSGASFASFGPTTSLTWSLRCSQILRPSTFDSSIPLVLLHRWHKVRTSYNNIVGCTDLLARPRAPHSSNIRLFTLPLASFPAPHTSYSPSQLPVARGAREGREGHRRRLLLVWSRGWRRYHDEPVEWHNHRSRTCKYLKLAPFLYHRSDRCMPPACIRLSTRTASTASKSPAARRTPTSRPPCSSCPA